MFFLDKLHAFALGTLPDGDYGRNTRIDYCCRFDGETSDEIVLPTSDPFYLFKYADLCQEASSNGCGLQNKSKQLQMVHSKGPWGQ